MLPVVGPRGLLAALGHPSASWFTLSGRWESEVPQEIAEILCVFLGLEPLAMQAGECVVLVADVPNAVELADSVAEVLASWLDLACGWVVALDRSVSVEIMACGQVAQVLRVIEPPQARTEFGDIAIARLRIGPDLSWHLDDFAPEPEPSALPPAARGAECAASAMHSLRAGTIRLSARPQPHFAWDAIDALEESGLWSIEAHPAAPPASPPVRAGVRCIACTAEETDPIPSLWTRSRCGHEFHRRCLLRFLQSIPPSDSRLCCLCR